MLPGAQDPGLSELSELGLGTGGPGATGGYDQSRTIPLDMTVRVVNLYVPQGSTEGAPIEVWTGSPEYGGHRLVTVDYGTVSDFFAPEIADPFGDVVLEKNNDYSLGYYPVGATTSDQALITKSETSSPGAKLTVLALPGDPDGQGMSMQTWADEVGSAPEAGNWNGTLPTPPAGSGLAIVNAAATQYLGSDGSAPGYVGAAQDGTCLQYYDTDTGKIHTDEFTDSLVGGTQSLTFVVTPGQKISLVPYQEQGTHQDNCAGKSAFAPLDPAVGAGGAAYLFVHGTSATELTALVVPLA
ncbi:hypothetical protein D1871_22870 [Nakamurella silvestris]|nr:hypothetical protein D1871_22870 [Nakamurella silvestris]